ncbi:MAG: Ni/Fe hydrogenase subunit alpha, partial [Actinomycetota bacterium]
GFKAEVERGLRIKRLGNDLLALIGGREIHPVSPMVGGFSKAPRPHDLRAFEPRLEDALAEILDVADWVGTLTYPSFPREAELVSMFHPGEYPMNEGDMASTSGRRWDAAGYEDVTREIQVEHSNALHSVFADTGTEYFLGPLARINVNEATLTPVARDAARRAGLTLPNPDPFLSMAARVAETALALEGALGLIRAYQPPDPPLAQVRPRAGRAMWMTEAPRGTLYHRYDVADDGTILEAKIVPPTSQNLRHMERDLREFLPGVLDRPDQELTRLCEMVVRNYDPCISCATHFLRVDVERV